MGVVSPGDGIAMVVPGPGCCGTTPRSGRRHRQGERSGRAAARFGTPTRVALGQRCEPFHGSVARPHRDDRQNATTSARSVREHPGGTGDASPEHRLAGLQRRWVIDRRTNEIAARQREEKAACRNRAGDVRRNVRVATRIASITGGTPAPPQTRTRACRRPCLVWLCHTGVRPVPVNHVAGASGVATTAAGAGAGAGGFLSFIITFFSPAFSSSMTAVVPASPRRR